MSLSLVDLEFLTSPRGAALLEDLRSADLSEATSLRLITLLRKTFTPDETRAALELARLRLKAVEKFAANADRMYFTRDALEQASDPLVRRYRAGWIMRENVLDVCCSMGSDALAFASTAHSVTGIDIDPVRVEMARLNAFALGVTNARFEIADARGDLRAYLTGKSHLFFDPARRDESGRRVYDVEAYEPPLSTLRNWTVSRLIAKLSPGIDLTQLAGYGGIVEFISVDGDLKEAALYTSPDAFGANPSRCAVLLTESDVLRWTLPDSMPDARLSEPRAWLIEPDAALIRAGLVRDAGGKWDAYQLDESTAYLTAENQPITEWARAWRIIDWMPFSVKKLRAFLRERNIGIVTVKKRGTAVTPETIIPQLKLKGDQSCTLVLTRRAGEQIVVVCEDIAVGDVGLTTEQDK